MSIMAGLKAFKDIPKYPQQTEVLDNFLKVFVAIL
jgi:hypothetical protein